MPPLAALMGIQGLTAIASIVTTLATLAAALLSFRASMALIETTLNSWSPTVKQYLALSGLPIALAMLATAVVAGATIRASRSLAGPLGALIKK